MNKYRMTVKQWRKAEGLESEEAFNKWMESQILESVAPALCEEGCEVEPDGCCPHGNYSVWMALGIV